MSYQQITIAGNLGRDPEMRYTPSGQAVTNLNVAASRKYTNGAGEKVEETVWFRVACWGKQAEVCNQYLKKGSKVLVTGRMQNPKPFQKQDGTWACSLDVNAQEVTFLGGGAHSEAAEPAAEPASEDIPF